MTTPETRELPAIPSLQGIDDQATLKVLGAIKTIIEARTIGPKEWLDANKLKGVNGVLANILGNGTGDDSLLNFATPPAPENLTADGTFNNIYLRWNHIPYSNHAYTEVWRASVNNLGDAILLSAVWGNLYADPVDDGVTYYYWVRFVSTAAVAGPFNLASGTVGQTSPEPSRILEALTGEITESHLLDALRNDIDLLRDEKIIKVDSRGYVAGIGIAVVNGDSGDPSGQVIIYADKFAIVTPSGDATKTIIPFVVGLVNGRSAVGVNGRLVVDGTIYGNAIVSKSITSDHITVGTLSAISANMGDVTAGTFRTGIAGSRVEISNVGAYRIWMGTGVKNNDNAAFFLNSNGDAVFAGRLAAAGGVFSGTLDAVDGVFTGTIYANKIIGDVIDRLAFKQLTRTILRAIVSNTLYTLNTIAVKADGFTRYLIFEGFSYLISVTSSSFTHGQSVAYRYYIYVDSKLTYDSGTKYKSTIGDFLTILIEYTDVMEYLTANADHKVYLKFKTLSSNPIPGDATVTVQISPGKRVIDTFKAESEGITVS